MSFKSFIKKLDLVAIEQKIQMNDHSRFQTFVGGLITIILIILIIISSVYFGQELWKKANPKVFINTKQVDEIKAVEIDPKDFYIVMEVTSNIDYLQYIDESIYSAKAIEITYSYDDKNGELIKSDKEIEFLSCNNYFQNISELDNSYIYDLKSSLCFKPNSKAKIENFWGSSKMSLITISFYKCSSNPSIDGLYKGNNSC